MLSFTLTAATVWAGCSSGPAEGESGEDAITGTKCQVFNNQTGRTVTQQELAALNDPIAKKILEGECPKTYSDILKKMKTTDATGCSGQDGLGSFMVSETAAFEIDPSKNQTGAYRTVVTKQCDNRKQEDLMFSGFASGRGVGETNVEMIGKDSVSGVFNYYEVLDGGQWVFYGNSFDFVGDGYECLPTGSCIAKNSNKASSPSGKSCASCHIGGGLVMKELDTPWVHWTGGSPNGAQKVADQFKDKLGGLQGGATFELSVVRPSMDPYNDKRIAFLATKGLEELLRPLFCTMDVNLDSALIGANAVIDRMLVNPTTTSISSFHGNKGGFFNVDQAVYGQLKSELKQRIEGVNTDFAGKPVTDTAIPFTYPERSHLDMSYVMSLERAKLVDPEFVSDVLNVDFTRSIFSGQRCSMLSNGKGTAGLVSKDPKLAELEGKLKDWAAAVKANDSKKDAIAADIAKAIPALFTAALQAKSTRSPAEDKLLTNLTDATQTSAQHQKDAQAFIAKCNARLQSTDAAAKKTALQDMMTYVSHVRKVMRKTVVGFNGQDLLEGGGRDDKMVTDSIPDNPNALDPDECLLTLPANQVKATTKK